MPRNNQSYPALNQKLVFKLARLIFNGFNDEEISLLANLPTAYIKALRLGHVDSSVRCVSLQFKDKAIEKIKRGQGRLGGLIWFLERRWPRQFARPDVQLSLSSGNTVNQTLVVSAEVADKIINRSKQALTEIDKLIADKQPAQASDSE